MNILKLAVLGILLTACHGARLSTPSGFATLDDAGAYSYRATSANGVVIATRTQPNEVKANTEFWADSLDAQLKGKGYVAEGESRSVTTGKGLVGTQFRYTKIREGRECRYWLTVFVTDAKVYVVEAGGEKDPFDKSTGTIASAIVSLNP